MITQKINKEQILSWLSEIYDPEIPVLTIVDLGIVRDIEILSQDCIQVYITPTYSGCPAMDILGMQIRMVLNARGFKCVEIINKLKPAWTTEWMSIESLNKLKKYGIAPPSKKTINEHQLFKEIEVECPRCESSDTELISQFGATSCKAMYKCKACLEPFEYFKCH